MVLAVSKTSATSAVLPMAMANSEVRINPSTLETNVPAPMSAEARVARDLDREASLGSVCSVSVMCFVYGVSQIVQPKVWEPWAALAVGKIIPYWIPWVHYQRLLEIRWACCPGGSRFGLGWGSAFGSVVRLGQAFGLVPRGWGVFWRHRRR